MMQVGDTIQLSRSVAILERINPRAETDAILGPDDIAVGAQLRYITLDTTYMIEPVYLIQERIARAVPLRIEGREITFAFSKIVPETAEIELTVEQRFPRYIIMKAIVFPFINLVWFGAVIMALGIMVSILRRISAKPS
jgi:cytochrome c-type biogenesis protein CcmF